MITCPNCGESVREGQRFCGSCGTDVQAALRAAPPPPTYSNEQPRMQYAYGEPSGYEYGMPPTGSSRPVPRLLIVGAALILAICCAFGCGLVFGFEIIPDVLGIGGTTAVPKPTLTPTPSSLIPIIHWFIG